jgi:hypothetical protein
MRIEKWKSSEGRAELHYFRAEDGEYLFGYNPQLVPEELLESVLKYINEID